MTNAFLLRIKPSSVNQIVDALKSDSIIIGWSYTKDRLFDKNLTRDDFREILKTMNPTRDYDDNNRSLGYATGVMWRFMREMNKGDLIVVPADSGLFYVCEVTEDDPFYLKDKESSDAAIRRKVKWHCDKKPIPRKFADSGLTSRMKVQGSCVAAGDLVSSIKTAETDFLKGKAANFNDEAFESLTKALYNKILSKESHLTSEKFEDLMVDLFISMGAKAKKTSKKRIPKKDADVDIIADFEHLGIRIYVQVKYHINSEETDTWAVTQIINAVKWEENDSSNPIYGWAITTGTFDTEAKLLAQENDIRLIEGKELAELLVKFNVLGNDNNS